MTDYNKMMDSIASVITGEQFYTKTLVNKMVKINVYTTDTERSPDTKRKNIIHHSYQLKDDRTYETYKYIFLSLQMTLKDLEEKVHKVCNILNVYHRIIK